MPYTPSALSEMADGLSVDRVRLHSGDPGGSGTDNVESGLVAATFGSAASGVRALTADVDFTGLTANADITWFSVWVNSGTVFKGSFPITSGDVAANAAGEYTLTTGAELRVQNPA